MGLLSRLRSFSRPSDDVKLPDFSGKTLVIYPVQDRISGGMFQDAKAVHIGSCVFIVGRRVGLEPPSQQRWSQALIWTSIHQIAQILVFDDLESARRTLDGDWSEFNLRLT